jgi:hypothetical protein
MLNSLKELPYGLDGAYSQMKTLYLVTASILTVGVGLAWVMSGVFKKGGDKVVEETVKEVAKNSLKDKVIDAAINAGTSTLSSWGTQAVSNAGSDTASNITISVDSKGNPVPQYKPGDEMYEAEREAIRQYKETH